MILTSIGFHQIALDDVVQVAGHTVLHDQAVAVTFFTPAEVAQCHDVGHIGIVADIHAGTTDERAAIVGAIESGIPTRTPTTVKIQIVGRRVGDQHAGVRPRLSAPHGERVAVEEVTGSGNFLVANRAEEVTQLDRPVAVGDIDIRLGHGPAVDTVIQTVDEVVVTGRVAVGLCVLSIDTVEHVDAPTDVESATSVSSIFGVQPQLMQIEIVGMCIHIVSGDNRRIAVIAELHPATDGHVFVEQSVRFAETAATVSAAGAAARSAGGFRCTTFLGQCRQLLIQLVTDVVEQFVAALRLCGRDTLVVAGQRRAAADQTGTADGDRNKPDLSHETVNHWILPLFRLEKVDSFPSDSRRLETVRYSTRTNFSARGLVAS